MPHVIIVGLIVHKRPNPRVLSPGACPAGHVGGLHCHDPPTARARRTDMTRIAMARNRVEQADGLAAMLDSAHDAFEDMLSVIRAHEDPADGMFVPLVMAAASAADGRDAIVFAPSLPLH